MRKRQRSGRVRSGIREWRQQRRRTPRFSTAAEQERDGSSGWATMPRVQRILRTRHEGPGVITAAHETRVREDLMTLPGWSLGAGSDTQRNISLHNCGHFPTSRSVIVMVAGALEEGTTGGVECQHAIVVPDLLDTRVCSKEQRPRSGMGWPLLGLSDPDAQPDVHGSPAEASECHRLAKGNGRARDGKETAYGTNWEEDAQGQERENFRPRRQLAKTDSCYGGTSPSCQTARTQGSKSAKAEDGGAELRPGRDHHGADPARRQTKAGGLCFFALISSFSKRNRVHEICQRGDRHSSFPSQLKSDVGSRCQPARAIVRAVTVAFSSPACTQRSICRGAASASRLDLLAFSDNKRGRSKALFFAVLNEPVNSTGPTDKLPPRQP